MTAERGVGRSRTWLWAACLLLGATVAFLVAFAITSAIGSRGLLGSTDAGLRWDLAVLNGTMGLLGLAAVVGAARVAFGAWPNLMGWPLVVAAMGISVAIAQELALHQWVEAHVGQYDFDNVLPTALLSWTTLLVTAVAFAALVAPSRAVQVPFSALLVATSVACWITAMNTRGLADGIAADSWPLAVLIGVSALFAVGCLVIGAWRLRRG